MVPNWDSEIQSVPKSIAQSFTFSGISYLPHSATTNTSIDSLFSEILNACSFTFINGQCWSVGHLEDKFLLTGRQLSAHEKSACVSSQPNTQRRRHTATHRWAGAWPQSGESQSDGRCFRHDVINCARDQPARDRPTFVVYRLPSWEPQDGLCVFESDWMATNRAGSSHEQSVKWGEGQPDRMQAVWHAL